MWCARAGRRRRRAHPPTPCARTLLKNRPRQLPTSNFHFPTLEGSTKPVPSRCWVLEVGIDPGFFSEVLTVQRRHPALGISRARGGAARRGGRELGELAGAQDDIRGGGVFLQARPRLGPGD